MLGALCPSRTNVAQMGTSVDWLCRIEATAGESPNIFAARSCTEKIK
jgi:hypothetical protein